MWRWGWEQSRVLILMRHVVVVCVIDILIRIRDLPVLIYILAWNEEYPIVAKKMVSVSTTNPKDKNQWAFNEAFSISFSFDYCWRNCRTPFLKRRIRRHHHQALQLHMWWNENLKWWMRTFKMASSCCRLRACLSVWQVFPCESRNSSVSELWIFSFRVVFFVGVSVYRLK